MNRELAHPIVANHVYLQPSEMLRAVFVNQDLACSIMAEYDSRKRTQFAWPSEVVLILREPCDKLMTCNYSNEGCAGTRVKQKLLHFVVALHSGAGVARACCIQTVGQV